MKSGIYIVANDRVLEQAIALLNSIRLRDPDVAIVMIPYNELYQTAYEQLSQRFGVTLFDDFAALERLSENLQRIFGDKFFARPSVLRKFACWLGPLDKFIYIDTDIVVFEKISDSLKYLEDYDFICCDYQYTRGIADVFSQHVLETGLFTEADIQDVFNSGFMGARKDLLSESDLYKVFEECAAHPEYFDFSQKTSDQPILNYFILKHFPRRLNLVRANGKGPGNWAGSSHFQRDGMILIDPKVDRPLPFLHWAGFRIQPGCPYWEIWEDYRYLNEEKPLVQPKPQKPKSLVQRAVDKLKKIF